MQACLAMVAKIPIDEAISEMARHSGYGSAPLYKALKKYKIDYLSWRSVDNVDELPPLCILGIEFPTYGHSVLYHDGVFYDPEFGVLKEYTPGGKITTYLELYNDEVYEGRDFKVKIPQDFQEAFNTDHLAFDVFLKLPYPQRSKCINMISHYKNPEVRKANIAKQIEKLKNHI